MTCEEFAIAGLELGASPENAPLQQAAREHLRNCPHCAALHENWLALRDDLHALGVESREREASSRVEMRLRQEFRTRHRIMRSRRTAVVATWMLAAAAVLVAAVSWINWRHQQLLTAHSHGTVNTTGVQPSPNPLAAAAPAVAELGDVVVAANSGDFALLPGSFPPSLGDATVVHVQMQRSELAALGLTVNEEQGSDWIQVDLLVGDDGLPQAVRLPQSTD